MEKPELSPRAREVLWSYYEAQQRGIRSTEARYLYELSRLQKPFWYSEALIELHSQLCRLHDLGLVELQVDDHKHIDTVTVTHAGEVWLKDELRSKPDGLAVELMETARNLTERTRKRAEARGGTGGLVHTYPPDDDILSDAWFSVAYSAAATLLLVAAGRTGGAVHQGLACMEQLAETLALQARKRATESGENETSSNGGFVRAGTDGDGNGSRSSGGDVPGDPDPGCSDG